MPTPAELIAESLTALRNAKRFSHTSNSYRKDNPNEYAKVIAYLDGGARPTGTLTEMGKHAVLEEDVRRSLSPPVPPDPPTYPASYFTGPLGQGAAHFLPTKPGAFLFDFYGGIGLNDSQYEAAINQREQTMGRKFDGLMTHYGGEGTYGGFGNCASVHPYRLQWIHDRGSLALLSWAPNRSIAEVNSGTADGCFRAVADHLKALGFPVMLRIWWEFNLSGPNWHACGQSFTDAWRRVVGIFGERGASNVGFYWCPNNGVDYDCVHASYPGDEYVDWVGDDGYNWCQVTPSGCYSAPGIEGWAEFGQIYNHTAYDTIYKTYSQQKPYVVGETGTVYDASFPAKKGQWFRNIPAVARQMPRMYGIDFYDADVSAVGDKNWRVDYPTSDPSVYAGFVAMAKDPWFNTRT
jgi:hypothetical protein